MKIWTNDRRWNKFPESIEKWHSVGIHNSAMAIIAVHSPFEDSELVMPAFVTYFP
jgi:hypothetical protein